MSYWSKAVKWISQAKKASGQPSNTQVFIWKVLNCLAHASTKDICRVSTTSSSVCMFIQETFENHFWEVILPGTVHLTPGFFHITPSPLRMLFLTCCVAQFYENKNCTVEPPGFGGTENPASVYRNNAVLYCQHHQYLRPALGFFFFPTRSPEARVDGRRRSIFSFSSVAHCHCPCLCCVCAESQRQICIAAMRARTGSSGAAGLCAWVCDDCSAWLHIWQWTGSGGRFISFIYFF